MTIIPGQYDITVYQGATFSQLLTWKDESGTPINLTNYTARMMARTSIDAAAPFLTLSSPSNGITLGGAAGTISLSISAAATALLESGGVYDLELEDAGGNVTRLLQGNMLLNKEVTR